jgi:hypothetical protein
MLYEADTAYTDSTVYKQPPYYITNTLDSAVTFRLENLKAGAYHLIAIKDEGRNNVFDPSADKVGFVADTVILPTDSVFQLRLFREIPSYGVLPPSFAASNRIVFGYNGAEIPEVSLLTQLPDSVRTLLVKEPGKDSLNLWFTPFSADSLIFEVRHPKIETLVDTFSLKPVNATRDTLTFSWSPSRVLNFTDTVFLNATIPLRSIDTSLFRMMDADSLPVALESQLDTLQNRVRLDFPKDPNQTYFIEILPGGISDFFETANDTLRTRWGTGSPADYGNLRMSLQGTPRFPLIVELIGQKNELVRSKYLTGYEEVEFPYLNPGNYRIRIIFDANQNGKWDTGSFLEKKQPERVIYYPGAIEMRANWEKVETFIIQG